NVSGRGVGMDVVKSNIEKIGGMIDISSQPGKGMTLRLKIPLTLAIVPAMIIRSGTDRYAIPQVKLVELVRAERNKTEHQIEYLQGKPVYRLRGNLLPLIDLREVLGVSDPKSEKSVATLPDCVNIVVLNAERQIFGLMVDEILDTADIVVKPLSRFLKTLSVYSGATVLGDGSVALILDVLGVAQRQLLATESGNGSSMASEEKDESGLWNEEQEFLLFRLNSQAKHAIPLSLVHRLEEFKASDIEYSGGQRVVRYRGTILPIVSLNDFLNYPAPENEIKREIMPVIVSQKGSRLFGIEVNEILDVTSTSHGLDDSLSDRKGILGNIMSSQGIIVLVDTLQILSTALERLSHSVSVDKTQVTKKAQNRRGHILFAEDTVFFRKHVGKVLENAGYDLSYAVNGASALDILNETSSSVPFDLILSDIEMPKMNGLELAKAIRKDTRLKHLPMIALTTRFNDHYAQEGIAAGFNLYLEKMNAEQLIKAIESLLKEKLEMEVA
ncbi:MAG: chemotaxis protein CheW, partial [Bdellovibrionota bacterium]